VHSADDLKLCVKIICSVLQCIAVCCRALQCVAVCRSVLQCIAVYCSVLQCVAVCCSTLLRVAVRSIVLQWSREQLQQSHLGTGAAVPVVSQCELLRYVAVCCSSASTPHTSPRHHTLSHHTHTHTNLTTAHTQHCIHIQNNERHNDERHFFLFVCIDVRGICVRLCARIVIWGGFD